MIAPRVRGWKKNNQRTQQANHPSLEHKHGQSGFCLRHQIRADKEDKIAVCQQSISILVRNQVQGLPAVEEYVLPGFRREVPPVALLIGVDTGAGKQNAWVEPEQAVQVSFRIGKVFENLEGNDQIGNLEVRFGEA